MEIGITGGVLDFVAVPPVRTMSHLKQQLCRKQLIRITRQRIQIMKRLTQIMRQRFRENPIVRDMERSAVAGVVVTPDGAVTIVRRVVAAIVLVGRMNINYRQGSVSQIRTQNVRMGSFIKKVRILVWLVRRKETLLKIRLLF